MRVYGPYTRKDNRQHIVIVHPDGRKQTKSYPRHLLEQHIGRELTIYETVDHIDEDKTNNDITNLQILSLSDNAKKAMLLRPRQVYKFVCPVCGIDAVKFLNHVKNNWRRRKAGPYCSRQCSGKVHN
jgi:hypothetical protein